MSRESKMRRKPGPTDKTRWQWHQLTRAQRMARGGRWQILTDLVKHYASEGTPTIRRAVGWMQTVDAQEPPRPTAAELRIRRLVRRSQET